MFYTSWKNAKGIYINYRDMDDEYINNALRVCVKGATYSLRYCIDLSLERFTRRLHKLHTTFMGCIGAI